MTPGFAAAQLVELLRKRVNGPNRTKQRDLDMAALIAGEIADLRGVGPYQWRCNHLLEYLARTLSTVAPATRYAHWRILRVAVEALGRNDWLGRLDHGPWVRPSGKPGRLNAGGRPRRRKATPPPS